MDTFKTSLLFINAIQRKQRAGLHCREDRAIETTGLETTGLETAELESAGLETAGLETTGLETMKWNAFEIETSKNKKSHLVKYYYFLV